MDRGGNRLVTRPVAQLERSVVRNLLGLYVVQICMMNRSTSWMDGFRTVNPNSLIGRRIRRRSVVLGNARVFHEIARR